ncbi:di-heme oxidoreductase family protein [Pyxidicoccus xibeiensis]|uniref:di-heme oxidoreductase family protein n=1 Tax=Pyxidicoccus xibeiensis TaxID=2906759 RepID=UPI0020A6EFC1|nr:di-heme oxidoredictase family protein [Pyxidicoccus xibeiensis]MCP3140724.1 c-type cytochrome [Pyxidicoccus xibeiensis]
MRGRLFLPGIPIVALVLTAVWADTVRRPPLLELGELASAAEPGEELSGGATTVVDAGRNSFGRSPMNLDRARWPDFHHGKKVFARDWSDPRKTPVPVGPLFSAASCMTCHVKDGRGRPPASPAEPPVSIVFQLSASGGRGPHPSYGEQLDFHGVGGSAGEGSVTVDYDERSDEFASGESFSLLQPRYTFKHLARGPLGEGVPFSPRVAPVNFGLGLLEAIPEEALLALADPDDRDQDGISGRPNQVEDVAERRTKLGRFGWKANQPSVLQQSAHALFADMGLTTELFPGQAGSAPEVTPEDLERLLFYTRLVAVPRRRNWDAPPVLRGKAVFRAIGCSGCHVSTPFETGDVPGFPELSRQRIFPYTDLLLHDLGAGLADGRPDGQASGQEWRTPPLWGIGLVEAVNGHTRFLHDGRARNLEEAILWHGGEAAPTQERYVRLPREDREALLAFLNSL